MDKQKLYTHAYKILEHSTPLRIDCGRLCGKICCTGQDENTGMYLFPGEEAMFQPIPHWLQIKSARWMAEENSSVLLAVCNGSCDRRQRPLACRIFPLTPYISSNGILRIKMDPRAEAVCPLVRYSGRNKLDQSFVGNVRKVFNILLDDAEIKEFVVQLSTMLDEYSQLPWSKLT